MKDFWIKYKKWIIGAVLVVMFGAGISIASCNCGYKLAKGCYQVDTEKSEKKIEEKVKK
jgi:hypothetical protein